MSAQPLPLISVEEYLEGEKHSEVRHEYIDGYVVAMAGASDAHELVAGNLFVALTLHLRGKGCRVFQSGMKVRLDFMRYGLFYYPDVMVACDPTDNDRYFRRRPKLLIEVLSADENKDLVERYLAYQRIASLEEYVVASQDPAHPAVHIFRREDGWEPTELQTDPAASFTLRSVGLTLSLGELYVA